jgi:galactonate dehydratase
MQITNLRTVHVGVPGRNWTFIFIDTDEGLQGVGEATTEWHERAVEAAVQHLAPVLLGQDPTRIEFLWQKMFRQFWWRGGVVLSSAISGVDQALWDLTGKAYGQPVYRLLGGPCRDRVWVYTRTDRGLPTYVDEALAAQAEGFTAFKWGIPTDRVYEEPAWIDDGIATGHALRAAVGDEMELMVDCAGYFSVNGAIQLMRGLRDCRLLFIEEPVNGDNLDEFVHLRRAEPGMNVAMGERVMLRWGFRDVLERGAADVLQADISHAGGISELRKIANLAEVYGVRLAPHNPYGPVALAAAVHLAAAVPNFLILEHCRRSPLFWEIQKVGLALTDSYVELPTRPGLGIELDEALLAQHPYQPLPMRDFYQADGSVPLV